MTRKETIVIGRYAQAFLNRFQRDITVHNVAALENVVRFLQENRSVIALAKIPGLLASQQQMLMKQCLDRFALYPLLNPLVTLLIAHKRISYITEIIRVIIARYKRQQGITEFTIASSHLLDGDSQASIVHFLEKQTGNQIQGSFVLDTGLIAGIRMRSEEFLWEYSIAKQLRQIKLALIT